MCVYHLPRSEEPVFNPNPNAKPFVPKRQQMQQEIQKRLQQWKDFYYTQVQPQEAAAVAAQQQQQQQQSGRHSRLAA